MLAKHRSFRGSLTSKIKDALHFIFPTLPSINTNSLTEVRKWKGDPIVVKCHKVLFKREEEDSTTYMTRIISKIWPAKKNAPKLHIAYAISVCEFILNPSILRIQVSEASIKSQITKYLQRISNKEKLSSDVDESDDNNSAKSLEIPECNEGSEVLGERDHEIIRDEQEVEDCEIQRDDNVNIKSDDYLLESLMKKYEGKNQNFLYNY